LPSSCLNECFPLSIQKWKMNPRLYRSDNMSPFCPTTCFLDRQPWLLVPVDGVSGCAEEQHMWESLIVKSSFHSFWFIDHVRLSCHANNSLLLQSLYSFRKDK
jgi:hypothetical protein